MSPDYSKGKVYALRSFMTDKIYIGSTVQALSERLRGHKKDYKRYEEGNGFYVSSCELVKYPDCYIELVRNVPCETKEELRKAEGEEIRKTDCVNKTVAGRTNKEYYQDNKEKIVEWRKVYYKANKEKLAVYREANKEKATEYSKAYREANKEKVAGYSKAYREANKEKVAELGKAWREANKEKVAERNKAYHEANKEKIREHKKLYRETNAEKIKERSKAYREANKERIAKAEKQKATCECGSVVRKTELRKHRQTKKHLKSMQN